MSQKCKVMFNTAVLNTECIIYSCILYHIQHTYGQNILIFTFSKPFIFKTVVHKFICLEGCTKYITFNVLYIAHISHKYIVFKLMFLNKNLSKICIIIGNIFPYENYKWLQYFNLGFSDWNGFGSIAYSKRQIY